MPKNPFKNLVLKSSGYKKYKKFLSEYEEEEEEDEDNPETPTDYFVQFLESVIRKKKYGVDYMDCLDDLSDSMAVASNKEREELRQFIIGVLNLEKLPILKGLINTLAMPKIIKTKQPKLIKISLKFLADIANFILELKKLRNNEVDCKKYFKKLKLDYPGLNSINKILLDLEPKRILELD